jgi:hypothetical protein
MLRRLTGMTVLFALAIYYTVAAAADQDEIHSLEGLSGVYVTVDNINPAAEMLGLDRAKIHGDVELRLKQKGIPVLSIQQMRDTPGLPILKVLLNVHKTQSGLYVYSIDLHLRQNAQLTRRPSIETFAITWKTGTLGIASEDQLTKVRDLVLDYVDEFIADYTKANPQRPT